MFYIDSSVAVAAVTAEPSTGTVLKWMAGREDILISDWVITEAFAAVSQKHRMRILSAEEHGRALAALRQQIGESFPALAVTRDAFQAAAGFLERSEIGLWAGDALHLAMALAADATLVTLDKGQARASQMLRIRNLLLA